MIRDDLAPIAKAIRAAIDAEVTLSPSAAKFWDAVLRVDPYGTRAFTLKTVYRSLGWHYPTATGWFIRQDMPDPSACMRWARIAYAAALFDRPDDRCSVVAYRIGMASPQSMGRMLRHELGLTPLLFREQVPFPVARERLLDAVIHNHIQQWEEFSTDEHTLRRRTKMRTYLAKRMAAA